MQILMFSYGSGAAGSMFMLRGRRSGNPRFNLDLLSRKVREFAAAVPSVRDFSASSQSGS